MTQPELLLTNGITPSMARAGLEVDRLCIVNLKAMARNLSRNAAVRKGREG